MQAETIRENVSEITEDSKFQRRIALFRKSLWEDLSGNFGELVAKSIVKVADYNMVEHNIIGANYILGLQEQEQKEIHQMRLDDGMTEESIKKLQDEGFLSK